MDFLGPIQNSLLATPSPRYLFDWRMVSDTGLATQCTDLSGKGNHSVTFGTAGTPGQALSQPGCWTAAPGYLTMATKANAVGDFASLAMATFNSAWSYANGDSFLLFLRGKFTLPGVDTPFFGTGVSAARPGFKGTIKAVSGGGSAPAGRVVIGFYPSSGTNIFMNDTTIAVASASPVDVSFALFVDGQARTMSAYINGLVNRLNEALPLQDYVAIKDLVIGGAINFTNYDGVDSKISEAQMLVWRSSAPSNPAQIIARLHSIPFHRLTAEEAP